MFVCTITQEHDEDGFYHLQSFVQKGCAMGLSVTFAFVGESSIRQFTKFTQTVVYKGFKTGVTKLLQGVFLWKRN